MNNKEFSEQLFMAELNLDGDKSKISQLPYEEFYMGYGIHLPTATIDVWGDIDQNTCQIAVQGIHLLTRAHAKTKKYPTLTVNIHSQGGDWYSGIALYSAIRNYPGQTICLVQGTAMSMASVILQAADRRISTANSTIMVHNGHDSASGNIDEVKRWTKHAEMICKQMYQIYADRSGKTTRYWKSKCGTDYILDADKALKEGLIDEIIW